MIRFLAAVALLAHVSFAAPQPDINDTLAAARSAEASGDFARAESIYSAVLKSHPDAELYQRLGLVRHLQNKFEAASQAFKEALRLNPRLWSSHLFLGIDYYRLNRFREALPHLEQADRLNPNVQEIHFWLGATQLALNDYLHGLETLEGVLTKDPNNADVLRLLAESYAAYGTQVLNRTAEKYPDSAAGLAIEGKAFEFEGSYESALNAYLKAAAKDPGLPGIRESIARVQANLRPK